MKFFLFLILIAAFLMKIMHASSLGNVTGFTATNIAIYLVGLILAVTEYSTGRLSRKRMPGVGFAIVITAGVVLSLVYAKFIGVYGGSLLDNARQAKSFVFDPAALYVFAFLLIDTREQGRRYLLILVGVLGVLNVLSAIAAHYGFQIYRVASTYVENAETQERLSGFTGNPNKTAYLICVLIAFQYYFFKFHQSRLVRYALAAIMAGELIVVLQTGSRGGLLVLVVLVGSLAYRLRDMRVIVAAAALTATAVAILLLSGSALFQHSIDRVASLTFEHSGNITTGRTLIWSSLLSDYLKSFIGVLFGNGFGSSLFMGIHANPHNIYLQNLAEFGLVGLGLFVYFVVSLFRKVLRARIDMDLALRASVLASAYVILFAWLFTTMVGALDLVWFTIGVGMATLFSPEKGGAVRGSHTGKSVSVGRSRPAGHAGA